MDIPLYYFSLQIRMSQAYRMGFEDISRNSSLHRLFIQKYILASSGEDDGDSISGAIENLDGVRILKSITLILPSYSAREDRLG